MCRSFVVMTSFVLLSVLAFSPGGAVAYSLPGTTGLQALTQDFTTGNGVFDEPSALLIMGAVLLGASWAVRRRTPAN